MGDMFMLSEEGLARIEPFFPLPVVWREWMTAKWFRVLFMSLCCLAVLSRAHRLSELFQSSRVVMPCKPDWTRD
ncbi:MAG: hypothetical protein GDA39_04380 [Hyphomonadaceae bacterium]|nr:hypothetical protein [Hyphomonadaceae bacterium]MBC6412168.1 hypothetical protein [Hyphomonadaceae bacterium]